MLFLGGQVMGTEREKLSTQFTEPTIIQDIFATGTAHVGAAGDGAVRLTFYVDIEISSGGREAEHRINDRVILPREAIPALLSMLTDAMASRPQGGAGQRRAAGHH